MGEDFLLQFMHKAAEEHATTLISSSHFDSQKDDCFNFVESMWYVRTVGVGLGELRKGENELSMRKEAVQITIELVVFLGIRTETSCQAEHLDSDGGTLRYMISYMRSEDNDIDYDIIGFEITMIS
jgi:hypothetical protein